MKWYPVSGIEPTNTPFIKKLTLGGKSICLVNYDNKLFALGATCPHAGEDLSKGWCKDSKLVCPYHRFSYDIKTGKGSPGQNDYVESYPVKLKNGEVLIGIESFFDRLKQAFK